MTRYFFNIRDGDDLVRDEDGVVCPDLDAARVEAVQSARDLLAEQLRRGRALDGQIIEITNEAGRIVEAFPLRGAIPVADQRTLH